MTEIPSSSYVDASAGQKTPTGAQHIALAFEQAHAENRATLITYHTLGYPTAKKSVESAAAAIAGGADILELGIPFSDPLADGPIIQRSTHVALEQRTTVRQCLEMAQSLRRRYSAVPFIFMGYYNPILAFGEEAFCRACQVAGIDGLIVPDLPPEEGTSLEKLCEQNSLALVYLLAPTSTPKRIDLVTQRSTGFVYLVSVVGITGPRANLPPDLSTFIRRVRAATDKPLVVGFGISSPEQAAQVAKQADGIVVGSAVMRLAAEPDGEERVLSLVTELRQATSTPSVDR